MIKPTKELLGKIGAWIRDKFATKGEKHGSPEVSPEILLKGSINESEITIICVPIIVIQNVEVKQ